MLVELFNAVQDAAKPEIVEVNGQSYVRHAVHHPPDEKPIKPLQCQTLTSVIDYLVKSEEMPEIDGQDIKVHIVSPTCVRVVGGLIHRDNARHCYLEATCTDIIGSGFSYGRFLEPDKFVIDLLTQFQDTEDRGKIMQIVGNLKAESVTISEDDGYSQTVTVRSGVARASEKDVPNELELKPFRTFREVEQPASLFTLRTRSSGAGELPTCGLFEADGGAWKLDAIQVIKLWLKQHGVECPILA